MRTLNHETARFVVYVESETGKLKAYLTDTDDMEAIRREIVDLGRPVSVHQPVFEGVDAEEQKKMFDLLCGMGRVTEPNANPWHVLQTIFMLGYTANLEQAPVRTGIRPVGGIRRPTPPKRG
jgi:hypothetical protein